MSSQTRNVLAAAAPGAGRGFTLGPMQEGAPCCEPLPAIEVAGVSIAYGGKPALSEVTLDLYRGCITALIGPSGCGKSSFLWSLNRLTDLIPDCRVTGDVVVGGESIYRRGCDVRALRRRVGMVFQRPNPFPMSVRRNLDMPMREHGIGNRTERADRVEKALRDVGLWSEVGDRLDSSALALSGGQQQRLCIARALVLEPEVLLLDEPCSALDPMSSAVVEDLVRALAGAYTIVIVTHNLAQARRVANYAGFFWMRERSGTLIEFGRCRQIFDAPRHELTTAYVRGAQG